MRMRYCKKCKVSVAGSRNKCPLCQSELVGATGSFEDKFPEIIKRKSGIDFVFGLLIAICAAIVIVCAVINYMLPKSGSWSGFVAGGAVTLWIVLLVVMKKCKNVLKCLFYETIVIALLLVAWDIFTGMNCWSVNFAIPCLFSASVISMGIVSKALKIPPEDHGIYLMSLTSFGIICGVFLLNNIVKIGLPSVICICISSLLLIVLVVFEGDSMWHEFKKRFHT